MSRPLRIEYPGAWYHVMNRGINYKNIFKDDVDREMFLKLIGESCELWGIKIHAYCLMANHYHLLVETPEGGLGRAMRHLNGVYKQRFNRKKGMIYKNCFIIPGRAIFIIWARRKNRSGLQPPMC